jgi:hypothetical protein
VIIEHVSVRALALSIEVADKKHDATVTELPFYRRT